MVIYKLHQLLVFLTKFDVWNIFLISIGEDGGEFHGGLVVELLAFGSVSKVLGHIKCRYYWKKWFVTWLVK